MPIRTSTPLSSDLMERPPEATTFKQRMGDFFWANLPADLAVITVVVAIVLFTDRGDERFYILAVAVPVTYLLFYQRRRKAVAEYRKEHDL